MNVNSRLTGLHISANYCEGFARDNRQCQIERAGVIIFSVSYFHFHVNASGLNVQLDVLFSSFQPHAEAVEY